MDGLTLTLDTLAAALRVAVPLILAALAGLFGERAGIVDIGLEGRMLAAAFAAASAAAVSGSAWIGLAAALLVAVLLALLHGYACIAHRGNQVISGLAINIIASGLTPVLGNAWFQRGGETPTLPGSARFLPIELPFATSLESVPLLGPIYANLISGHSLLSYAALAAVPLTAWVVFRTRFGLRLRAAGENPAAVDTAGLSVAGLRYQAMMISGLLTGLAGTYLSIAQNAFYTHDMTAGRGYLALAAMIFGKWRPWPTLAACLLFGLLDALEARLQGVDLPVIGPLPGQLIQATPYILTVLLLAGFVGRSVAPKASGLPYIKERS